MTALAVEEALARITGGVPPLGAERVALAHAQSRVLAEDLRARLTQPPFASSAMDGYAVRAANVARLPATLEVIGEAAAGHAFSGTVGDGQCVRIMTGAPVPTGADTVVIQEQVRREGTRVIVSAEYQPGGYIRPRGCDFRQGETLLAVGRRLTPRDVTLAAAMNHDALPVRVRPKVAVLATGDELVPPGGAPRPDQIVASVSYGVAAMVAQAGGVPELQDIAGDRLDSLEAAIAAAGGADILVTIGGASVGDYDFVRQALERRGMALEFWKIAMRPGKPLMFGRLDGQRVLGLPGNPVSAMICARIFLVPLIDRLLGRSGGDTSWVTAALTTAVGANGPRQHYMRAVLSDDRLSVTPLPSQDSSLLVPLSRADCLIIRPPHAPAETEGATVRVVPIDF